MPKPDDKVMVLSKRTGKSQPMTKAEFDAGYASDPNYEMQGYVAPGAGKGPDFLGYKPPGEEKAPAAPKGVKMVDPQTGEVHEGIDPTKVKEAVAMGLEPHREPAEESTLDKILGSDFAKTGAGVLQGLTSGLAQHGAGALVSAMAPEGAGFTPEAAQRAREMGMSERQTPTEAPAMGREEATKMVSESLPRDHAGYVGGDIGGTILQAMLLKRGAGALMDKAPQAVRLASQLAGRTASKAPVIAGTGAAVGAGAAEGAVRSAADQSAVGDVDARQVASDAGLSGGMGAVGSLGMRALAMPFRKASQGLREPNTKLAASVGELEEAGGQLSAPRSPNVLPMRRFPFARIEEGSGSLGGPEAPPIARRFAQRQGQEAYERAQGRATTKDPIEVTGESLAKDRAPRVAQKLKGLHDEVEGQMQQANARFYQSAVGQMQRPPIQTKNELRKILATRTSEDGGDLPWASTGELKKALSAMGEGAAEEAAQHRASMEQAALQLQQIGERQARGLMQVDDTARIAELEATIEGAQDAIDGLGTLAQGRMNAQQFDEALGALERKIYESKSKDPAMKRLAAAMHADRQGWGEQWQRTKESHALQMNEMGRRKRVLGINNTDEIPATALVDPRHIPDVANERISEKLFNWADNEELTKVARELGLEEYLKPVKGEAAATRLKSGQSVRVVGSGAGVTPVTNVDALRMRADPLFRFIGDQNRLRQQAQQGVFFGTASEHLESTVGEVPRNTMDFMLRLREAKRDREEQGQ